MEDTSTESNTLTEGGSSKLANHLRLLRMLAAELYAYGPLAIRAINLKRTPRKTGKSGTLKYCVNVIYERKWLNLLDQVPLASPRSLRAQLSS